MCDEFEYEDEEDLKRQIKEAQQSVNDGFFYTFIDGELKCNKCGRFGILRERPFPHRYDCPMKK